MKIEINHYKKKISILTLIVLLFQIFSPYTNLISTVLAAENSAPDYKYLVMNIDKSEDAQLDYSEYGIAHITLELRGNLNFSGFDVCFSYDKNILTPTYNAGTNRRPNYVEATTMEDWEVTTNAFGSDISENNTWLFADEGKFRIEGTAATDKNPDTLGGSVVIGDLYFLLEEGYTLDNIPSTVFTMEPGNGLTTGIKLVYDSYDWVTDSKYYGTEGFVLPEKEVDSIAVKTNPTNTTYEHGDTINLAGGEITVTYTDGTTKDISMTDAKVSLVSNIANVNVPTVTLSYEGKQTTFSITVTDPVQSLSIVTPMSNVEYNQGENFDFSTLVLQATKKSGVTQSLTATSNGVTVSETSADINSSNFTQVSPSETIPISGTQIIEFGYTGKTVTQTVVVNDKISSVNLTSQPTKQVYKYSETLDLSGATVKVTLESGAVANINLPDGSVSVSGFSNTTTGAKQNLTVSFGGKTAPEKIEVEVYNYVKNIDLTSPTNRRPNYDTEIDLAGASITENWADGTVTMNKPVTSTMLSGYNKQLVGPQTVTATYPVTYTLSDGTTINDSFTKTFTVNVQDNVTSVTITKPTKETYNHGESLDLTGGEITIDYASGATVVEPIASATITEADGTTAVNMSPASYDSTNKLDKTLKITYTKDGVPGSANYPITIINDVREITIHSENHKKVYNVNETLDTTNLEISVQRAVGTEVVSMPNSNISVTGFSSASANPTLPLTVSYTENGITKTATYKVEIKDVVTSISVEPKPNKTVYKYGEALSTEGGMLTVTKGSGTSQVAITESMVTEENGSPFNSSILGERDLTVTYGQDINGNPVTTTFKVTVKDYVTEITVNPTSVNGKYNDELSALINDNNITYTVTYAQKGDQTPVALDANMVTGYDKTSLTAQSLTVKYTDNDANSYTNGTDFPATLNVTLQDEVISINVGTMPKQNYQYGESLDVSTGTLNIVKDSGTVTIPITSNMVTEANGDPFNPKILGTRNLIVTYGQDANGNPVTTPYEVTVSDYVLGIILTPPTKVTYEYGESLELSGGSVQKVMASGAATTPVALSDSSVTLSTFDNTQIGAQTINVTYEGKTESFGVVVEDNIQSIAMKNTPKAVYKYGEALDVTNGTIEATRSSGTKEVINITNSMVTGFDPQTLGTQTLTVKHGDKTTSYDVEVQDYIKDIEITKPNKLIYNIGDTIDLTGGKVKPVMASGTATTPVEMTNSQVTISGFDTTTEGAKTITVTYQGIPKTFSITVVDPLNEVILSSLPDKTEYLYGESLDVTGAKLTVKKVSGESQVINVTKDMITGYNPKKLGEQTLTVTYEGFTQQFKVNVNDYISSLKIQQPTKTEYEYGENLDLTGGKVSVIMASGKVNETVEMTASMISGFDSKQTGTQTIQVEYKDLQGKFQVNVIDKVKGISINTEPNKVKYEYGENLDITGATITVIKSSGIITVPVTKDMVSGYNPQTPGTQLITVTYAGFTTKFIVNVEEKPEEPVQEPEQKEPEKVVTPVKPNKTPITENNTTITENTPIQEPVQEPEQPVKPNDNTTQTTEEKPAEILETKDEGISEETVAVIIGGLGLLFLILLLVFKRNVKIYVVEDGEFVLGGTDKIKSKNPKLDIDQYLDGETYNNKVKIRLSDSISEKLDGKEIEIKHRGKKIKHKVVYNDEPYEIILK